MIKGLFPVVTDSSLEFPDAFFDNFFNDFENSSEGGYRVPRVDIEDADNAYIITADLPGMDKKDITLTYKDDVLTIMAKHDEQKDEKDDQSKYIRKERLNQTYCRQFTARNIEKEGIQAAYKDGVLTVTLPKVDPKKAIEAHKIEVQ